MAARLRSARPSAIAALVLAAAAALTACGGGEPPAEPSASSGAESTGPGSTESASETTTTTAGPPPLTAPASGLVLVRCEEGSYALSTLDPATAAETPLVEFALVGDPTYGCLRLRDYAPLVLQATFDPTFSRLAVGLVGETDGSERVGWQHADGSVVDVSAALADLAGEPVEDLTHSSPVFGPEGTFWFIDEGSRELVSVPVADDGALGAVTRVAHPDDRRFLVTPWGGVWANFLADPGSTCTNAPGPDGSLFTASSAEISPQAWLSGDEVLQLEQSGTVLAFSVGIEHPGGAGFCPSSGVAMVPAADRQVVSPVAGAGGAKVAYLERQGDALALGVFDWATDAASTVGSLDASGSAAFLVAWRP